MALSKKTPYQLALEQFQRDREAGEPPRPPAVLPPDYRYYYTCAVCWSYFPPNPGRIARFFHRRKWGHNPQMGARAIRAA